MTEKGAAHRHEKGQSGIVRAALFGLCPRCGAATLFEAPGRVALECDQCALDFSSLERGGRLAGLLTAIVAIVLMALATALDMAFEIPFALQLAIWAPVTVLGTLFVLRLFKTVLLYAAYERRGGDET